MLQTPLSPVHARRDATAPVVVQDKVIRAAWVPATPMVALARLVA
jgi:hypothetical protein